MQYVMDQSIKTLVQNVRDGWYGNEYPPPPGGMGPTLVRENCGMVKKPASCNKCIEHAIKECDKRVVWCLSIEGTMRGGVTILPGYFADTTVPIDAIIDLTRADLHNPNEADDGQVDLSIDSDEVEEGVTVNRGATGGEADAEIEAQPVRVRVTFAAISSDPAPTDLLFAPPPGTVSY